MEEATTNRCAYVEAGLRCIRTDHPLEPDAHIRQNGSWVPDRHPGAAA